MSQGYSFAGHIGYAKESSGGTPVAATNYIEALSENIQTSIERFDVKNIVGRYAEPDDMAGLRRHAGDLVFACQPDELGFFLQGMLGVQSNAEVLSGFLHTHNFTFRTTDFDASYAEQPLTFEIFRDVSSSQQFAGCNIGAMGFAIAPNQDVRITTAIIGTDVLNITGTTPTFVTSPTDPLAFDTTSIEIGGAATALVEGFNIQLDSQLNGVPSLNNSTIIRAIKRTGPQMVRLSGNIAFEDIEEYENFRNQTEQQLKVSFFRADSFSLTFDIPRFIYSSYPLTMGGRDRQVVAFDGIARYHTGSNQIIQIDLTNTTSGY